MPRRSGRGVPLGALKKHANSCAACHAPLGTEEPIAWTWARQRLHEACMPIWAFAARGRRALGEWIAEPVGLLLARHQGRLCSTCLALALSLSLEEARQVVEITANVPGFRVLPVACAACGRETMALCTVPTEAAPTAELVATLGKCTHCSRPFGERDSIVRLGQDQYHRACVKILGSRDRIRSGRTLSRQTRASIERARAMLDRPRRLD